MRCKSKRITLPGAALYACFLAAGLPAGQAAAQAPIPLQPKEFQPAPPAPVSPDAPEAANDGIRVDSLGEMDFSNAGLLTRDNSGFGSDMWRGAEGALVARLLPQLPAATPSVVLQTLYRRLLLSAADIPAGWTSKTSLLAMRLERLMSAGQFETARQLAALAGDATRDEAILQTRADGALAENDLPAACAMANNAIRTSTAVYWLKLSGFCHILNGNEEAAQLAAAMAAEQAPDDPGYQNLLTALISKSSKAPAELPHPDILQIAMLRFASMTPPANIHAGASPAVLKLIADTQSAPLEQRLRAAERAEIYGAIAPEKLAALYGETPFSVQERANAQTIAAKLKGPRANALMYQSVRGQDDPANQAKALALAFSLARASDSLAAVARINLTPARDLVPAPEQIGSAADIGRALMAAGDPAAASRWYELARALSSSGDANAASAASALWPLVRLSLSADAMPEDSGALQGWLMQLPPEEKARKGELLLAAMSGLGLATPDSAWYELAVAQQKAAAQETPSMATLHLLRASAQSGKIGQTILLCLIAAGKDAEGLAQPMLLQTLLQALTQLGLHNEARALAVEAALRAGI